MKTLEEKIGQMFIVRLQGKNIDTELETLIKEYHIGGVSLYSRNYDSYEEMIDIINKLKKMNSKYNDIPLFISVDQEGGRVNRLPKDFKIIPSAKKVSSDKKYVKESALITGELLKDLGINMNFSPVLDIQRFKDSHAIGDRCYGKDAKSVSENGLLMMNTLKKNVIPVVKHFPGHGLVKRDSHLFLPFINTKIEETEDLIPFIKAINYNTPAIMISHIMLRKMDKFYPASLSKKIITDFLKNKLNYKGLIITDDLKMKAVNFLYGYKKSTLKAIEAGNDIILIGANYTDVFDCINNIKLKLNSSLIENIENSYNKIIKIKKEFNVTDKEVKKIKIDKYNERIEKLRKEVF